MKAIRTFYNTGQALFAVERLHFNDALYTIVYDCGNDAKNSSGSRVKDKIELAFKKDEKVDALYISHYDSDHVNGVVHLLNHCQVKHVFLPMLNPGQELWFNIDYSTNDLIYRIYYHQEDTFQQDNMRFNIHKVNIFNQNEDEQITTNTESFDNLIGNINSGVGVRLAGNGDEPDWVYVTHNINSWDTNIWNGFIQLLGLPSGSTPQDLVTKWKAKDVTCSELKKIFIGANRAAGVKVSKESEFINEHSMTLYSGPIDNNLASSNYNLDLSTHCYNSHKKATDCECIIGLCGAGCLYLGDYNAKKNVQLLKNCYFRIWHNIGLIQIPHHGSKNNFSSDIIIKGGLHIIPIERRSGQVNPTFVEDEIKNQREFVKLVDHDLEIRIFDRQRGPL